MEAKGTRDYLAEFAGEMDAEEERAQHAIIAKFRAMALGHIGHIRDLRAYWESKNPLG